MFLRKTHSRVLREVRYTLTLRYAYGGQGPPWAPLANQPPTPFVIVKRNHAASSLAARHPCITGARGRRRGQPPSPRRPPAMPWTRLAPPSRATAPAWRITGVQVA